MDESARVTFMRALRIRSVGRKRRLGGVKCTVEKDRDILGNFLYIMHSSYIMLSLKEFTS